MNRYVNALILLVFFCLFGGLSQAVAETKRSWWGWSNEHNHYREIKQYDQYLENSRHEQVPQWAHEDWYAEDWTSQTDGMSLIRGFYKADILRDQKTGHADLPMLIVGPNFYHLSGYDKRRVAHIVDVVYGITASKPHGSFILQDWNTRRPIGVFDSNGLTLN